MLDAVIFMQEGVDAEELSERPADHFEGAVKKPRAGTGQDVQLVCRGQRYMTLSVHANVLLRKGRWQEVPVQMKVHSRRLGWTKFHAAAVVRRSCQIVNVRSASRRGVNCCLKLLHK